MIQILLILLAVTGTAPADEVGKALSELGAPKYATRQAAQERLVEAGTSDTAVVLTRAVRQYAMTADPEVRERLRDVMATVVDKTIYSRPRGFLGIHMQAVLVMEGQQPNTPKARIQVSNVTTESAAEKAGLQPGDQITGVDGQALDQRAALQKFTEYIRDQKPGTIVKLQVQRNGVAMDVPVALGQMPAELQEQLFSESRKSEFFEQWLQSQLARLPPVPQQKIDKPLRAR